MIIAGDDYKKSRFSESQIIAVLNETNTESKIGAICRQYGISSATFYKWEAKLKKYLLTCRLKIMRLRS